MEGEEDFQLCHIDDIQKMLDQEEEERFGNTNTNFSIPECEQSNMDGSKEKKNVDYSMGAYFATRSSFPFANLNDMVTLLEDTKYPNDLPEKDEKLPGVEIVRQQDTIHEFDEKNSMYSNSDVSNLFQNKTNEGSDNKKKKRSSTYSIQSSQRGRGYSLGSWVDSTVDDGIEGVLQPIQNNSSSTNITQSMEENNGSINSLVQFFQDPDKTPLSSKEIMEHVLQYCKTRSTTGTSSNSKYKHINKNNNESIISNATSSITKGIDKSSASTSKENRLLLHRKSADSYLNGDDEQSQRLDSFDWSMNANHLKSYNISNASNNSNMKPSFLFDNHPVLKKQENKKASTESLAHYANNNNNNNINSSNKKPRQSVEYKAFSAELNQSKKKSSRSSTPDSGISRNDDYRKSSIGSLCPTTTSTTTSTATNNDYGGRNDSGCDNSQLNKVKTSSAIATTSLRNKSTNNNGSYATTAAAFQQKQQQHVIESQNNGSDFKSENYVAMSSSMSMISKTVNIGSRRNIGRKSIEKSVPISNTPVLKIKECKQSTNTFPIIELNEQEEQQTQQQQQQKSLPPTSTAFNQERQVTSSVPTNQQEQQRLAQPINVQFNFPMPPLPSSAAETSSSVNLPPIVITIGYPSAPSTTNNNNNNNGLNDGQPRMSLQFSGTIQYH